MLTLSGNGTDWGGEGRGSRRRIRDALGGYEGRQGVFAAEAESWGGDRAHHGGRGCGCECWRWKRDDFDIAA